jgi:hypothetical protein
MKNILSLLNKILFPSSEQMDSWFSSAESNPIYGSKVFSQKSWLEKRVDEAMRKKAFNID